MNQDSTQKPVPTPQAPQTPNSGGPDSDPAINVTNTFKPDQVIAGQKKGEDPVEETKDLFEEGLEFEPEPDKIPKEPSMQDIRPQPEKTVPTPPVQPLPQEAPRKVEQTPPGAETTIPQEEQEALNKIQKTKLSDLGIHAAPPQQPGTQQTGGPPPKKRSFCGLLIGAGLLILVLGGGGYAYFAFFAKVSLTIVLNVDDAEIMIDEQNYTSQVTNNQLKISLSPGVHEFKVSKEEYFTYQKSLTASNIPSHQLAIELRSYPEPLQILQYKASDLSADFENGYIFYRSNNGKTLYYLKLETEDKGSTAKSITPDIMTPVSKILFSPDYNYAILKVTQGPAVAGTPFAGQSSPANTEMTFLYDFAGLDKTKQTATFLGDDIGDIKWSKKAYIFFVQNNKIIKTDKSFSDFETILDFSEEGYENPQISVSKNENYLSLISQSKDYSNNNVLLFNTETNEVLPVTDDGNKLSAVFNSDETVLLFSSYDKGSNPKETIDAYLIDSQEIEKLQINTTLSKTCFIDTNTFLYSKYNESSKTDDLIASYLTSDTTTQYVYKDKGVEFNELWFDETSEYLYFINKELIYSLKLDDGEY